MIVNNIMMIKTSSQYLELELTQFSEGMCTTLATLRKTFGTKMLSRWLPDIDYKKAKLRCKENLVRRNKYCKFPNLVNTMFESVWNGKIEDSWDQLYDTLMHTNVMWVDKLETEVN